MNALSIHQARRCTFRSSWRTGANPRIMAAVRARSSDAADDPVPICGPIRITRGERRFAVAILIDATDEHVLDVIYKVQTIEDDWGAEEAVEEVVGGEAGLFELLSIIVDSSPVIAELTVELTLPGAQVSVPELPRMPAAERSRLDAAALEFGGEVTVEQVGYRFVDGAGGLQELELVYLHEEDEYGLELTARGPFQVILPDLIPAGIEELVAVVLARFFTVREA